MAYTHQSIHRLQTGSKSRSYLSFAYKRHISLANMDTNTKKKDGKGDSRLRERKKKRAGIITLISDDVDFNRKSNKSKRYSEHHPIIIKGTTQEENIR